MDVSREQFEQAVLLSFNQNADASYRGAAFASLEQLKGAPDGWRFCLEGLVQSQHAEVKFWCLQALCELVIQGRYATFSRDEAAQMQHTLFSWLEGTPATEQPFIKVGLLPTRREPRSSHRSRSRRREWPAGGAAGCRPTT
jgi:hypothetical protein